VAVLQLLPRLRRIGSRRNARKLGEKPLIVTDILRFLPQAIAAATEECAGLPDAV
jgi:hypothetical protein